MIAIVGTYKDGILKLDKEYKSNNPVKVIVTFLEDVTLETEKAFSISDFSFKKSQKNLKNYKGSISQALIEQRN